MSQLRWVSCLALLLFGTPSVYAATPAQIDEARLNAVWWLITHQNGDGSWKSGPGSEVAATAEALQALRNAGVTRYPYATGVSWLSNADAYSVDALSRKIIALSAAGLNVAPLTTRLSSWQWVQPATGSFWAGWGAYAYYEPTFPDTPLALSAFRTVTSDYSSFDPTIPSRPLLGKVLACSILAAQNSSTDPAVNGSWSFIRPGTSAPASAVAGSILPTTYNILEIAAINAVTNWSSRSCGGVYYLTDPPGAKGAITKGIDWLVQKQDVGGGFGDNGVTVLETALAYSVLKTLRPTDAATGLALDYLIDQQNDTNGGWGNDAFTTALVLRLLPATTLADTDRDGIPDGVEPKTGTNPNVADSRWLTKGNGSAVVGITAPVVLTNAVMRQAFSYPLTASGGAPPYSWGIVAGSLPQGVTLGASTGVISGVPMSAGVYDFIYRVTDTASATTDVPGILYVGRDPTPPVISSVVVSNITETTATISWTTNEPATSTVNYGLSASYGSQTTDSALVTAHQMQLTGLSDNSTYYYAISGVDIDVNAAVTVTGSFFVPELTPPTVPGNLTATAAGNVQQVTLTWTASFDATPGPISYQVERCQNAGCGNYAVRVATQQLGFSDAGTLPGQVYQYRVRAVDYAGNVGNYTNVVSVTTAATPTPIPPLTYSQAWTATYSGPGNSDDEIIGSRKVVTDSSGNVYVTGWSGDDFLTVKYGPSGNQVWFARYVAGMPIQPRAEFVDQSGNVYVSGTTCPNEECEVQDYVVVKYNASGTYQWNARYDNGGADYAGIVKVDTAGSVYVTGTSFNGTNFDIATVKYDANGIQQWFRRYDGGSDDQGAILAVDGSGNVYVNGSTCVNAGCTNRNYVTIKYNAAGTQQWTPAQIYDGGTVEYPTAMEIDTSANVYVTGMSSGATSYDYATVKYNTAGTQLWAVRYDGGSADYAFPLGLDASGNVYVSGTSFNGVSTDLTTVKYNSAGVQQWVIRADGGDYDDIISLMMDSAGNPYVMGNFGPITSSTVVKYDTNGNQLWVASIGGAAGALWADSAQSVYVAGTAGDWPADYLTTKLTQDTTAPSPAPASLAAVAVSPTQINLTWTGSTDNASTPTYDVQRCAGAGCTPVTIATSATTSYSSTGLAAGTSYSFKVRAVDSSGNTSAFSNTATTTTPSSLTITKVGRGQGTVTSSPAGISCGATCTATFTTGTSVTLTAAAATGSAAAGFTGSCTSSTTTCVLTVTGAAAVTVTFNDTQAPAAPTGVTATDVPNDNGGAISLGWVVSTATDVTQQRVYRGPASTGPYTLITTFTNNTANAFTDTGLTNGTTYYYVIRAYDGTRESANSTPRSIIPVDNVAPAAPSGLTAVDRPADNGGAVNLTWVVSPGTDVTQQRVYRSTSSGGTYSLVTTIPNNTTTAYTNTGLTNGTTYYYVVRAYDSNTTLGSVDSNQASAAPAINRTFHMHNETSALSSARQLRQAGPDVAALNVQSGALASGVNVIAEFETQTGDPNGTTTLAAGASVSFTVYLQKTAASGTMTAHAKLYKNSPISGNLICSATGATALTTTMAAYTFTCAVPTGGVAFIPTDRVYVSVGVNVTVVPAVGTLVNLGLEGTLNGARDSRVVVPWP